jgi:alanine racemase
MTDRGENDNNGEKDENDGARRWAWAKVDLDAIEHNVELIRTAAAPAELWAVVKADGYGHGAVPVAHAALRAGAAGLCVALVQEGLELRAAGIELPILVLSEQPAAQAADAVRAGLISTVYSIAQIEALAAAGAAGHRVQIKVDTGMHRVGCRPEAALAIARAVLTHRGLRLDGVWTHLAIADQPDDEYTIRQLDSFDAVLAGFAAAGIDPGRVHAANSAGALAHPRARYGLVRVGIAMYGIVPGPGVRHQSGGLRPAMSIEARVSHLQHVAAGERLSYGLRHRFASDTTVATVPIGYADGVPRRMFETHGHVLIRGRACPIVGVVTMDQLMVDVGAVVGHPPASATGATRATSPTGATGEIGIGEPVVLIGAQGGATIRAEDWADALGTIGYEVVCGISKRISRYHVGAHHPAVS